MSCNSLVKVQHKDAQSSLYAPEVEEDQSLACENLCKNANNGTEGKWSDQENLKYISFMVYHRDIFVSTRKRKIHRIFKKMSDFLKTRQPRQCRSHFQKLMKRFKNLANCQKFFINKHGPETFNLKYKENVCDFQMSVKLESNATEPSDVQSKTIGIQTDFPPYISPELMYQYFLQYNNQMQQCFISYPGLTFNGLNTYIPSQASKIQ